jgi:hypothetical protein
MWARLTLGVVTGVLLAAAPASAAEPFYASPFGSGAACTHAMPCQLTKAVEEVQAGGSVVVEPGTYSPAAFFLNKAVDVGGLQGAGASTVIEVTTGGFSQINSAGAVVHDLTFRTSGTAGGLNLLSGTAERIVSKLVGSSGGGACVLDAQGAAPPLLRDSVCWADGTTAGQAGAELLLSSGLTSSAVLRNDDLISAASGGFGLSVSASTAGTHFAVAAVNVIAEGSSKDVRARGTTGGQATLTLSHSNFSTQVVEGEATASAPTANGNQQSAPLFVAPASGEFRELPNSPTLEMGLTDPENGSLDLAGALRTRSTCAETFTDIGAYQLTSAAPPPCTPPPGSAGGNGGGGSPPSNHIKLGRLKRILNNGTAVLSLTVPGAGKLTLSGKGVKRVTKTAHAAGTLKLRIVTTGRSKANLGSRGRVKLSVTIGFAPTGGTAAQVHRKLTLLKKVPRASA